MNQGQLFRSIADEGMEGGFFIGDNLPEESGTLGGVLVVNISAEKNNSISTIIKRIVNAISRQPVAKKHIDRDRQLLKLIETVYGEYKRLVIIINDAHLLPPRTIKPLKTFRESCDNPYPAVFFIGDKEKLIKKILKIPTICQRTSEITKDGKLNRVYNIQAPLNEIDS